MKVLPPQLSNITWESSLKILGVALIGVARGGAGGAGAPPQGEEKKIF